VKVLLDRSAARKWLSSKDGPLLSEAASSRLPHLQRQRTEASEKTLRDQLLLARSCQAVAESAPNWLGRTGPQRNPSSTTL
jgi:hypothetical protein